MKIAVDLGHGVGQDRGAVGIITEESVINSVGTLVIQGLRNLGHQVLEVRPSGQGMSVSQSLSYRTTSSNNFGAELYVSIHANAGGGVGTEIFTYQASKMSQAVNVLNNIVNLGFRNRGIKDGSNLYVIRNTIAPAMLIEICFVDTQSDVDLYNKVGYTAIANAIIKGINNNTTVEVPSNPGVPSTPVVTGDEWTRRLQREINIQGFGTLVVDGIPGPKTLAAAPLVKINARGNITKLIQEKVGVSNDGIFGNITKNAVMNYQSRNNLSADGIVGNNTWTKLLGL